VLESLESASRYADWIAKLMQEFVTGRVLEVGAGHGVITERLARLGPVVAAEPSPRAAARLRDRTAGIDGVQVVECDLTEAATLGPFDTAVAVNVLEHIVDDVGALRSLRSALSPGGNVVLFVPAFELLYSRFDAQVGHIRRYRRSTMSDVLGAAGFAITEMRYVNAPGALLWLVFNRLLALPPSPTAIRAYDRVVVPLVRAIETGRRAPFGQSLLAVGRAPA